MGLLGQPVHCLRHAIEEKRLGFLFAAMSVRCRNQFLRLRNR